MIQTRQVRVFAMGPLSLLVAGCAQEQAPATQAPAGPDALVERVLTQEEQNALTPDDIRRNSSLLKEMEDNGEIRIVGGLYDMDTGLVSFLE